MKERIEKLTRLLCEWNRHKWKDKENKLLNEIWNLFEKECLAEWRKQTERR